MQIFFFFFLEMNVVTLSTADKEMSLRVLRLSETSSAFSLQPRLDLESNGTFSAAAAHSDVCSGCKVSQDCDYHRDHNYFFIQQW